jgi:hypothetical protein
LKVFVNSSNLLSFSRCSLKMPSYASCVVPSGPVTKTGIWPKPDRTVTEGNRTVGHGHTNFFVDRSSVWWHHKTDFNLARPVTTGH